MITLQQALNQYLQNRRLSDRTRKDYKSFLERCVPDWLDLELEKIDKQMCLDRYRALKSNCSSYATSNGLGQANVVFRILRAVINFAIALHDLKMSNPVASFSKLGAWAQLEDRKTFISVENLPAWYQHVLALPAVDRDFYLFVLLTGLRAGEAAGLRWSEVNLESAMISVPGSRTKNGKPHIFPIASELVRILRERKILTGKSVYVFIEPGRDVAYHVGRRVYERLEADLEFDCNPHALRRTFATHARHKCGIEFHTIKRCLNHTTRDVTDKYIQADPESLRSAFESVANYLLAVCKQEKPRVRLTLQQVKHAI